MTMQKKALSWNDISYETLGGLGVGGTLAALDRYLLGNKDWKHNLLVGGAGGVAGAGAGHMLRRGVSNASAEKSREELLRRNISSAPLVPRLGADAAAGVGGYKASKKILKLLSNKAAQDAASLPPSQARSAFHAAAEQAKVNPTSEAMGAMDKAAQEYYRSFGQYPDGYVSSAAQKSGDLAAMRNQLSKDLKAAKTAEQTLSGKARTAGNSATQASSNMRAAERNLRDAIRRGSSPADIQQLRAAYTAAAGDYNRAAQLSSDLRSQASDAAKKARSMSEAFTKAQADLTQHTTALKNATTASSGAPAPEFERSMWAREKLNKYWSKVNPTSKASAHIKDAYVKLGNKLTRPHYQTISNMASVGTGIGSAVLMDRYGVPLLQETFNPISSRDAYMQAVIESSAGLPENERSALLSEAAGKAGLNWNTETKSAFGLGNE